MSAERIPITAAKKLAAEQDADVVIILAWNQRLNMSHVVTYGKTVAQCKHAADYGNKLKRAIGFPDALCHDVPARAKRKTVV